MKNFNDFLNESARDLMTGKSKEEIDNAINNVDPNRMLEIAIKLYDLDMVKKAIKKGANLSKDLLEDLTFGFYYDDCIVDDFKKYGGILSKTSEIVDNWFLTEDDVDESKENKEKIINFNKEVLKIFLLDETVTYSLSGIEIIGYRTLLGLN